MKPGFSFEMKRLMGSMKLRGSSFLWFTALAGLAAVPAVAQIRPMGVPAPRPPAANQPKTATPEAPVPGNPDFKSDQPAVQPVPVPALPPVGDAWC